MTQLTRVGEVEALIGSRGIAVEIQPQAIGRAVNDMTQHGVMCEVAKETGWGVLAVVHLSFKTKKQDARAWIKKNTLWQVDSVDCTGCDVSGY